MRIYFLIHTHTHMKPKTAVRTHKIGCMEKRVLLACLEIKKIRGKEMGKRGKKVRENLLDVASVLTIICFCFYGFGKQYNLPIITQRI